MLLTPQIRAKLEAASAEFAQIIDKKARQLSARITPGAVISNMALGAMADCIGSWLHANSQADLEEHIDILTRAIRERYAHHRAHCPGSHEHH